MFKLILSRFYSALCEKLRLVDFLVFSRTVYQELLWLIDDYSRSLCVFTDKREGSVDVLQMAVTSASVTYRRSEPNSSSVPCVSLELWNNEFIMKKQLWWRCKHKLYRFICLEMVSDPFSHTQTMWFSSVGQPRHHQSSSQTAAKTISASMSLPDTSILLAVHLPESGRWEPSKRIVADGDVNVFWLFFFSGFIPMWHVWSEGLRTQTGALDVKLLTCRLDEYEATAAGRLLSEL